MWDRWLTRWTDGWPGKKFGGLLLGMLGLALATTILKLLLFEEHLHTVTLVYILIVMLVAIRYGFLPGIVISILGFLALNYFFIPPFYTFEMTSSSGILAAIGFLLASSLTSQIAARARRKTREAEQSRQEIAILNQLNIAVLSRAEATAMLGEVVQQVAACLEASAIQLCVARSDEGLPQFEKIELKTQEIVELEKLVDEKQVAEVFQTGETLFHKVTGYRVAYLPLERTNQTLGVMVLVLPLKVERSNRSTENVFSLEEQRWYKMIANQIALAIEHARLVKETAQVASLKESDRLKSALLVSVSHDLRTPLTAIKNAVAGLRDQEIKLEPEEEQEYLSLIDQESDRLSRLITNLLDLNRIEAGTLKLNKGLYYLPEIIEQTIERLNRTSTLVARHPINTRFEENLPLIPVDYIQLEQVITNLLENAAKYSAPGKLITISVRRELRPQPRLTRGRYTDLVLAGGSRDGSKPRQEPNNLTEDKTEQDEGILVEVMDEGIGVPPQELTRIFNKFYRVNQDGATNTLGPVSGSGIGLAICKGIIEAHGGYIWAQRRAYGGTTLSFWLPSAIVKPGTGNLPSLPEDI
jgi:two-component system sensor histidine kinase KdpD